MSGATLSSQDSIAIDENNYQRRIWAWTMYDWANSAFATTILAAVLPVYYSQVAGATLPSADRATAYWSTGLSIALFFTAIISPILGTISDIVRGKKRFLSVFLAVGTIATGLLVLVDRGDWLLASILFILGRVGFSGTLVFYDALLPHVAREEDRDMVSARGYALGYLGGGLLLAINIMMIFTFPGNWGPRLAFLSVALWWVLFSIPLLRLVPEPPSATMALRAGETVLSASFKRMRETFSQLRHFRDLLKYLAAFLVYNDGIGTIIGVAAIYGAELGFGSMELILAILLVQFVGIPFSLVFGRLPSPSETRRPIFLAFILFNLVVLPVAGLLAVRHLPAQIVGALPPDLPATETAVDEGVYDVHSNVLSFKGNWESALIAAATLGSDEAVTYAQTDEPDAQLELVFHGRQVELTYKSGPEMGVWAVYVDGVPLTGEDGQPLTVDGYRSTVRYGNTHTFTVDDVGEHILTLVNSGQRHPQSRGTSISVAQIEVLPLFPQSDLALVLGLLLLIEAIGVGFAALFGQAFFRGLAALMDTKRSIFLALVTYSLIAIWGFFLRSVIEFWFLAWLVAMVQGGSQALSRSLYASMTPASKSGEFFGLFSIMEKFASFSGPLFFAAAVAFFDNSRPGILSLIFFFVVGGFLLTRVDVEKGRAVARAEEQATLTTS